ncbi:outer membrane protein [Psittacicella gerlachiana]|uniref:outer membrane protein n=1 Tax=Psittacicella gerlachiana TaxID=2028574 RepID=UPI001CA6AE8C|nr:outer membrane beta-barrel protein [Psittacicella gerlachiana]
MEIFIRKVFLATALALGLVAGAQANSTSDLYNRYNNDLKFNLAVGYGFTKFGNIDHSFYAPVSKLGVDFALARFGQDQRHVIYFGPELAFTYSSKNLDSGKFKGEEAGTSIATKVTQYTVGVKTTYVLETPNLPVDHYVSLGLGMNNVHYSLNNGSEGTTQNTHGMYVSLEGGVKFHMGLTLGVEYRHAWKTGLKNTAYDTSSNSVNLLVGYAF